MVLMNLAARAVIALGVVGLPAVASAQTSTAGIAGVRDVAIGQFHTCAISRDGLVFCWGDNGFNQLGNSTNVPRPTPGRVPGLSGEFVSISAGRFHTCALNTAGTVYCWGDGTSGQLGEGNQDSGGIAVIPIGFETGAQEISAGAFHTCGIDAAGTGYCWGANADRQLGTGTDTLYVRQPAPVAGLPAGVTQIDAAISHSCGLTAEGRMMCWGSNLSGQLGLRRAAYRGSAANVAFLQDGNREIVAEGTNSCVLTRLRRVLCWGSNGSGQLGEFLGEQANTPTRVAGLPAGVHGLTFGSFEGYLGTACVLTRSNRSLCWGGNRYGQLGDGTLEDRTGPAAVTGLGAGIQRIVAGAGDHICAILRNGTLRCWGANLNGQLGDGGYVSSTVPVGVLGRLHRR